MEILKSDRSGLVHLGGGFSSQCLTNGVGVSKLVMAGVDERKALTKLRVLKGEYDKIRCFLGSAALYTDFSLVANSGKYLINIEQDYVTGKPLRGLLDAKNPTQRDFFQRSLRLYQATGLVPDLLPDIMPDPSGGVYFAGKYAYRSGPNVFLVEGDPLLVDTTLNRSLRSSITGPILRALVARKIERLLR